MSGPERDDGVVLWSDERGSDGGDLSTVHGPRTTAWLESSADRQGPRPRGRRAHVGGLHGRIGRRVPTDHILKIYYIYN